MDILLYATGVLSLAYTVYAVVSVRRIVARHLAGRGGISPCE